MIGLLVYTGWGVTIGEDYMTCRGGGCVHPDNSLVDTRHIELLLGQWWPAS